MYTKQYNTVPCCLRYWFCLFIPSMSFWIDPFFLFINWIYSVACFKIWARDVYKMINFSHCDLFFHPQHTLTTHITPHDEQGVDLIGRNHTGPPILQCCHVAIIRLQAEWRHHLACEAGCRPAVEHYRRRWQMTTTDTDRWRQTPSIVTSLAPPYTMCRWWGPPPTLCVGGPVISSGLQGSSATALITVTVKKLFQHLRIVNTSG